MSMIGFLIGFILGIFSLICLALCQTQNDTSTEESIYFAISTEIEGIKLYIDRKGVYGEFSISDTLLASNINTLKSRYGSITGKSIDNDLILEKIGINTRFIQSFN